ncbi:dTMP kinase [bacterium]|nr:dTMP kinase [bacterium]
MQSSLKLSKGLFFSFEGLDGSGKSLQSEALTRRLRDHGYNVLQLRDPGGTQISEAIRNILLDLRHNAMDSVTELLLYEAARSQVVAEKIKPALSRGDIVICDRFYDSTTAYQGYGRGLSLELIGKANDIGSHGITPHRTYILDIPWDESLKRRAGTKADRLESEARQFYADIREGYRKMTDAAPERFLWLDGTASPDQLEQTIGLDAFKNIDHINPFGQV